MSEQSKPTLPEPYGSVGFLIGFALSGVYFHLVITLVPNHYWPLHFALLFPIVLILTGVPALFEKVYWRRLEATNPQGGTENDE